MSKYSSLLNTIVEAVGGVDDPNVGASGEPTPELAPDGVNEPAGSNKNYNKPYVDLAGLMYKALLQDYSTLPESRVEMLATVNPDNIQSDEQAVAIIQKIEDALMESQGIDTSVVM